ncbi:hypothetical protein KIP69_16810 [Geobacter sulfurreducens]|jgi:hypothetical protein|uniref:CARDB domain-containing protein n=1 Tax=Geobacter sulfurreducens (strain ATCC 51573 / DSM 12127 / PCA) TaxID=243231 RepID=Q746V4_GEOSL|nr:hypothetical protein [Geobacter sulfurreducens]AAR36804.1 hypothetical protein GSU3414 [Geobacter sulfurreducens PCA]ADI86170.1 hypothetical protein KN400_3358 [Geobacter sulfurreducens KN400]AJY69667.1 hypothetical protein RW64_08635 [Geobacter sulfurreducens]QVW35223.1 hypothetical protein KIP69_16810 [Geobacter sulfurreducens]UAC04061.1 hypothetical protein KVP06_17175 [Geobacter sulfurreducens]
MKHKNIAQISAMTLGMLLTAGVAHAVSVNYTTTHVFKKEDIQCGRGIIGSTCLGNPVVEGSLTYYGIDSVYGWYVKNFDSSALQPKPRDGVYDDGRVADILDGSGNVIGVKVQNNETGNWKTGPIGGEWAKGLGALKAKAATEKYVVMDHLMRDPADPNPLQEGIDYNKRMKDDGKYLYFWGNYNQEPTPVYIYTALPLPDKWKVAGASYKVTSAKLVVDHDISNSPNDQIRPEDFENENATGILPQYTVCPTAPALAPAACSGLPAGTWVSAVDSQEGGDLELLPAGTVLKALNPATGLFEYTNAWYTTLDRDPFGGLNPRFRLKSSKYGQDLPGVEIPQYVVGTPTTTTIDLLTIKDPVTGLPVLADSKNWNNFLDEHTDIFGNYDPFDGYSMEDCPLTRDLDLMLYVKGEVGKPTVVRSAQLLVTYEDPDGVAVPTIDLAVTSVAIPTSASKSSVQTLKVTVDNLQAGVASGSLTLVGKNSSGVVVGNFSQTVATPADNSAVTYSFVWTAPSYGTTVKWEAKVTNEKDINGANNLKTASTVVKK